MHQLFLEAFPEDARSLACRCGKCERYDTRLETVATTLLEWRYIP